MEPNTKRPPSPAKIPETPESKKMKGNHPASGNCEEIPRLLDPKIFVKSAAEMGAAMDFMKGPPAVLTCMDVACGLYTIVYINKLVGNSEAYAYETFDAFTDQLHMQGSPFVRDTNFLGMAPRRVCKSENETIPVRYSDPKNDPKNQQKVLVFSLVGNRGWAKRMLLRKIKDVSTAEVKFVMYPKYTQIALNKAVEDEHGH